MGIKNYMGPTLILALPTTNWKMERFRMLIDSIWDPEKMGAELSDTGWTDGPWANKKLGELMNKKGIPRLRYHWIDTSKASSKNPIGLSDENTTCLYLLPMNIGNFKSGDDEMLISYTNTSQLPIENKYKIGYILSRWRKMIRVLEPSFAAIGHYQKHMQKHEGQDVRCFAWPAMYYGPEMVQKVGVEKLASCPYIYNGDELLPGGLFFRAENNPFMVSKEKLKALEKYLELPKLFPVQ